MSRHLLCLVPVLAVIASCGSNTGLQIVVTPRPEWHYPTDFDSIRVTVTAATLSGNGENDSQPEGQIFPLTQSDQPPYTVVVLENGAQYTEAKTITVALLNGDGNSFAQQVIGGGVPFTSGELKVVQVDWNTQ